jgi:hypothetical protein
MQDEFVGNSSDAPETARDDESNEYVQVWEIVTRVCVQHGLIRNNAQKSSSDDPTSE